jgi:hypothetical protein
LSWGKLRINAGKKEYMLENNSFIDEVTPLQFRLSQNYPNPFTEKTMIKYCIAYKTRVKLTVYNSEGEEIQKLIDEEKTAGTYEVVFQSAAGNKQLASGNYLYVLEAGDYKSEKEMFLQK